MFYVYVIQNDFGKIYIGQTSNLEERLKRHNGLLRNKSRSYTKINKGPWRVVYKDIFETRAEAINKENYLKSHVGRNWLRKNIQGALAQR